MDWSRFALVVARLLQPFLKGFSCGKCKVWIPLARIHTLYNFSLKIKGAGMDEIISVLDSDEEL
jgi:hypothetical protein